MKIFASVILAAVGAAAGQAADLGSCLSMKDANARLQCYDAVAKALRDKDGKEIVHWAGAGMTTTRPFHADGPFEIQWDARGFFQATLNHVGADKTIIANQTEGSTGSSYVSEGGDYYLDISALGPWRTRAVALPPGQAPDSADVQEPPAGENQAGLPPCNGPDASTEITELVQSSPWGQVAHIRVLDVGPITATLSPRGIEVCHTTLVTTGGTVKYDFQYMRQNGKIFTSGRPR